MSTRGEALLRRLAGRWTIIRTITNGAGLSGQATFTPQADGTSAYREEGRLILPNGQSFAATRDYVYEPTHDGFRVFFAEEPRSLFHEVSLTIEGAAATGDAHHWCRADLYRTHYAFTADDRFTITHTVKGPRHDYTMVTAYRR